MRSKNISGRCASLSSAPHIDAECQVLLRNLPMSLGYVQVVLSSKVQAVYGSRTEV